MKAYPYQPLQGVEIYIDTATFDDFEKDVSVPLEAQLGVIGGTLGLFAGFSILSGVELLPQDYGADHIKEQEIHVNQTGQAPVITDPRPTSSPIFFCEM